MAKSKTSYKEGLILLESGIIPTQEAFEEAIEKGYIASERIKGGRPKQFVSEAQKQFYEDKQAVLEDAKKAVEKVVSTFMQTYGSDWGDDGKLEFAVCVKGFIKAFNSFQPE